MTSFASHSDSTPAGAALRLGVLDKSPLAPGDTAADALARSVALARAADSWGYHRYWLAEHHNTAGVAGPSPEILIAHVIAQTSRIRVGSGGVMLQHYSPYKVAENFNLLASLAPGRIDLGVGKAPGGLPLSTRALQGDYDRSRRADFAGLAAELNAYLQDTDAPTGGDYPTLRATPIPPTPARQYLLGASVDSAQLAARLGWDFVYASHINAAAADLERAFDAYRAGSNGRAPLLAIAAVAAETHAAAAHFVTGQQRFRVQVGDAQAVNVGSLEQAQAFIRQSGGGEHRIEERETRIVHGTRAEVLGELAALSARYGIEEFIIDTPLADPEARLTSLRLLAPSYVSAPVAAVGGVEAVSEAETEAQAHA